MAFAGSPVPFGIDGLSVLDLGSGSGRDCYAVAGLVGPNGSVTGIDMTENQLSVARKHVPEFTKRMGYPKPNLRFVQGYIECLKEAGIQVCA
jgi:arsenite methyltransferase